MKNGWLRCDDLMISRLRHIRSRLFDGCRNKLTTIVFDDEQRLAVRTVTTNIEMRFLLICRAKLNMSKALLVRFG